MLTTLPLDGPMLSTGVGPIDGDHYLPLLPDHAFWGRLPCGADRPAVTVASGSSITVDTLSHEGLLADQGRNPLRFFGSHGVPADLVLREAVCLTSIRRHQPDLHGPHVVSSPIAVTGAQPGDLLAITVESLQRRVPYGVISNRHGRGALAGEFPETPGSVSVFAGVRDDGNGPARAVMPLRADGSGQVSFELRPFLGIMGVATFGSERPHSVPPGPFGGNLDINLLTEGSTLYLPVQVPGALAYLGDPHFAQGDGEVALTAMEASLRARVRLTVVPAAEAGERFGHLIGPLAETTEFLVPTGLDPDLDQAMANCVRAAIGLLEARYGMGRANALAYLSAATDFNVSQVVDLVKGVHARVRKADFR